MLVSHRYRFIYTKTVKTAGTSVESYFEPYCMKEGEWSFSNQRDEYISDAGIIGYRGKNRPDNCVWYNHMSAREIKNLLGQDIWDSYFKFCVVRNPFSKAVSWYYFRGRSNPFEPERIPLLKKQSNKQNRLSLQELYLPETKSIIEQKYAFELDYFNYSFPEQK